MNEFIELPVTKRSLSLKKLRYGVGINDASYQVYPMINGVQVECPYHAVWIKMIKRCYDPLVHKRQDTYTNCSVCIEWHTFSIFKDWMINQDWKGNQLDKDLLVPGNKVYSPETCIFVSKRVNNLIKPNEKKRGQYLLGVSWAAHRQMYLAQCSDGKRPKNLGYHDHEQDAHEAYCEYKANLIRQVASEQSNIKVKLALENIANTFYNN